MVRLSTSIYLSFPYLISNHAVFLEPGTKSVFWKLNDGTGHIKALVRRKIVLETLAISGREFDRSTDTIRAQLVDG
jgi:hypothetical protein